MVFFGKSLLKNKYFVGLPGKSCPNRADSLKRQYTHDYLLMKKDVGGDTVSGAVPLTVR